MLGRWINSFIVKFPRKPRLPFRQVKTILLLAITFVLARSGASANDDSSCDCQRRSLSSNQAGGLSGTLENNGITNVADLGNCSEALVGGARNKTAGGSSDERRMLNERGAPQLNSAHAELLSEQERSVLTVMASAPKVKYSYWGFANPEGNAENFPSGTKVSDLLDKEGNILLFRKISGPYLKGFTNRCIESEASTYSYSPSPSITWEWPDIGNNQSKILISIQNVDHDELLTWAKSSSEIKVLVTLRKTMNVQGFAVIKVPVAKENVVAIIDDSEMKKIMREYGSQPFSLQEFMQKVVNSPHVESAGLYRSK